MHFLEPIFNCPLLDEDDESSGDAGSTVDYSSESESTDASDAEDEDSSTSKGGETKRARSSRLEFGGQRYTLKQSQELRARLDAIITRAGWKTTSLLPLLRAKGLPWLEALEGFADALKEAGEGTSALAEQIQGARKNQRRIELVVRGFVAPRIEVFNRFLVRAACTAFNVKPPTSLAGLAGCKHLETVGDVAMFTHEEELAKESEGDDQTSEAEKGSQRKPRLRWIVYGPEKLSTVEGQALRARLEAIIAREAWKTETLYSLLRDQGSSWLDALNRFLEHLGAEREENVHIAQAIRTKKTRADIIEIVVRHAVAPHLNVFNKFLVGVACNAFDVRPPGSLAALAFCKLVKATKGSDLFTFAENEPCAAADRDTDSSPFLASTSNLAKKNIGFPLENSM